MIKGLKNFRHRSIRITDSLFREYSAMVAEKILPYQWEVLNDRVPGAEPTHCIENFRITAGEISGEHFGVVFRDTDLYKWLEAAAFCIEKTGDNSLCVLADEVIDLISRAQQPDGYINTYYTLVEPEKRWSNLVEGHELYTAGHFIEAAVAYYNATGKDKILNVAIKLADLICKTFGPNEEQIHGYPGHQEIELALVKLYRVTGQEEYLRCALYFIEARGKEPNYFTEEINRRGGAEFFSDFENYDLIYSQSHIPPREQTLAEGHAVRAMYMYSAMADLALDCDDEGLKMACNSIWHNLTERKIYITGSIGASGWLERFAADWDLPNNTNYSETCASVGLMMFGQRMCALTKDASYYDVVEAALYNTLVAGISKTGDRYFYINPLEVVPEFCLPNTYMQHVKPQRQKWFTVACCPPNIARTLASLGQYIYAYDDDSVYINQFVGSSLNEGETQIDIESELLKNGCVTITYKGNKTLKIRIPHYAGKTSLSVNGEKIAFKIEKHYAVLEGVNGVIQIDFDIKPRFVAANSAVRADVGKVALVNGPCVYCLEEIDNGDRLSSIYVSNDTEFKRMPPDEELSYDIPFIGYEGFKVETTAEEGVLYGAPVYSKQPIELRAIPYCLWCNRKPGEMLIWQKLLF